MCSTNLTHHGNDVRSTTWRVTGPVQKTASTSVKYGVNHRECSIFHFVESVYSSDQRVKIFDVPPPPP
jgi:hypothetical protein